VIAGCTRLIRGGPADAGLIVALGGPHARRLLAADVREDQRYWLRVWAVRGLLWAWDDGALPAVEVALRDEAWRVREMAAKVVARHLIGDALPAVADLREDPVPRVRSAAARALARLTGTGA